jgi:hypothetical protein
MHTLGAPTLSVSVLHTLPFGGCHYQRDPKSSIPIRMPSGCSASLHPSKDGSGQITSNLNGATGGNDYIYHF